MSAVIVMMDTLRDRLSHLTAISRLCPCSTMSGSMTEIHIVALVLTGAVQGLVGGAIGAGGGWLMTPVQYWAYVDMGIPSDIAIRMAFATGLFVMLPTMAGSAWGHHKRRSVWWNAALVMGGCGVAGAFGGAMVASHLPADPLKMVFGATVLFIGLRMLTAGSPVISAEPKFKAWTWVIWAVPIGFMSGLIGIGGGVFMVPVMTLVFGFPVHLAIGTSVAAISIMSVGGILGYVVGGMSAVGIPSPSIGYIYIWPWLCLVGASLLTIQVGVRIAHRVPAKQLTWVFSVLALYIGLRMLGLFDWVDWPI